MTDIRICVVFLSATFVRRTVVSYEHVAISARHTQKNSWCVRYCCPVLPKIGICRRGLVKFCNIIFHGRPFRGSGIITYGQTDMTKRPAVRVINREMSYLLRDCAQRQLDQRIRGGNIIKSLS